MILFSQWRNLPLSTRIKIAEQFGFKKVRSTHVANNEIVDDGFNIKDIEASLEVYHLQNYLDTAETDMGILWGWMVDKIEGREVNIPMKDILVVPEEVLEIAKQNSNGFDKPKKRK